MCEVNTPEARLIAIGIVTVLGMGLWYLTSAKA